MLTNIETELFTDCDDSDEHPHFIECDACQGQGFDAWDEADYRGEHVSRCEKCETCDGTGYVELDDSYVDAPDESEAA